VKEKYTEGDTD